jgi:hypothetical protein
MADAGELLLSLHQPLVGARRRAPADVADVHDEGERLGVDLVDQPVEPLDLRFGVRRVAQDAEAELARRQRRQRRATRGEQEN